MRTLALFICSTCAFAAPPVLSGVSLTPATSSSMVLAWITDVAASTQASCGTTSAASDRVFPPIAVDTGASTDTALTTSHSIIVPGFAASTTYYCKGISTAASETGTSAALSATTSAAASSTPVAVSFAAKPTNYNNQHNGTNGMPNNGRTVTGDTFAPATCANGNTYITGNDGFPQGGTPANIFWMQYSGGNHLQLTSVNNLTAYGGRAELGTVGTPFMGYTDGRGWKSGGPYCLGNRVFLPIMRMEAGGSFLQGNSSLITTANGGTSWESPVNRTPNTTGNPPTNGYGMFAGDGTMARPNFANVCNGNLGCPNVQNNADAYAYAVSFSVDATLSGAYLCRVPQRLLYRLNAADWSCYTSGDGNLDAAWTSTIANAVKLTGMPENFYTGQMMYVAAYRRWLLVGAQNLQTYVMDAPAPWGPFTLAGGYPQSSQKLGFGSWDAGSLADNGDGTYRVRVTTSGDYSTDDFTDDTNYSIHYLHATIAPKPAAARNVSKYVSGLDGSKFPSANLKLLYLGNESPGQTSFIDYSGNGNDAPLPTGIAYVQDGQGLKSFSSTFGATGVQVPFGPMTIIMGVRVDAAVAPYYDKLLEMWDGSSSSANVQLQRAGDGGTCRHQFSVTATPITALLDLCANTWNLFALRVGVNGSTTTVDVVDKAGTLINSASGTTPSGNPLMALYYGSGHVLAADMHSDLTLGVLGLHTASLSGVPLSEALKAAEKTLNERGVTVAAMSPISASSPMLTSMTPTTGAQGASVNVVLTGANLAAVNAVSAGTGITISANGTKTNTSVPLTFTIAAGAPTGTHTVTVYTPDGVSNTLNFTVTLTSFTGYLDTISNLANVYEVSRRALSGYTGPAVKVRTSATGNATQDIAYVSGELDTAALATFCGSNTCTVDTLYEQKNGNNATQSDPTKQPVLVDAGTLVTDGGKAAIRFDGGKYLTAATTLNSNYAQYFQVGSLASAASAYANAAGVLASGQSNCNDNIGSVTLLVRDNTANAVASFRNNSYLGPQAVTLNTPFWANLVYLASGGNYLTVGTATAVSSSSEASSFAGTTMSLGSCGTSAGGWGKISAAILVNSALSGGDQAAIHSAHQSRYGVQ